MPHVPPVHVWCAQPLLPSEQTLQLMGRMPLQSESFVHAFGSLGASQYVMPHLPAVQVWCAQPLEPSEQTSQDSGSGPVQSEFVVHSLAVLAAQ